MNLPKYINGTFLEDKSGDMFIVEDVNIDETLYLRHVKSDNMSYYSSNKSNSLRPMIVQPGCFISFTKPYKIPYLTVKTVYMVTHIGISGGKVWVELVTTDAFSKEIPYDKLKKMLFEFVEFQKA